MRRNVDTRPPETDTPSGARNESGVFLGHCTVYQFLDQAPPYRDSSLQTSLDLPSGTFETDTEVETLDLTPEQTFSQKRLH